jgi:hypothetical protein
MSMLVFWVVTPCGLVGRYQRFGERTASIFRSQVHRSENVKSYEESMFTNFRGVVWVGSYIRSVFAFNKDIISKGK